MPAKNGADRVKATRLRMKRDRKGKLSADEAAWLDDYEDSQDESDEEDEEIEGIPETPPVPGQVNASASERITYTEERKAAQGDHPHPDAYAAIATAQGLRADTLLRIATTALIQSNEQYMNMARLCLERTIAIETAHVQMLDVIREERLARIDAESEARMAEMAEGIAGEDGELAEMLKFAIASWQKNQGGGGRQVKAKRKKPRKSKPLGAID